MKWPQPLIKATLLRRYKRFLADVLLENGEEVTVHCPNTGAMTGCDISGSTVWLSRSDNPKRKYPFTWECIELEGSWVCIHSALANRVVAEALESRAIAELGEYCTFRREVKLSSGSRVDFLLNSSAKAPETFVEVKSVTLHMGGGVGAFPDAVSLRARRHIEELIALRQQGLGAVLFFAVMHSCIDRVSAARHIDPDYADLLSAAHSAGVEVLAYAVSINQAGISIDRALPVLL